MSQFDRTILAIGEENFNIISKATILIVGVGGVGGYVAEFLVRTGIQNLTIVDFDVIDETNLNRQIVALKSNVGKIKVEELKKRLLSINPLLKIDAINEKICKNNVEQIVCSKKFDYVVDAIDSKIDKADLIEFACKNNIPIISAMGSGNRVGVPHFEIKDIFKTQNDGLAKVMRKLLKERGVEALNVCLCDQPPIKTNGKVASMVFFPACSACVICGFVIEQLKNILNN